MDTNQPSPREVKFTSKMLSEFAGPVEVTATFTQDLDGFPEDPRLMVGNLDIGFFIDKKLLPALDIEARDALYAELADERQARAEDRAECRRDDAKAADAFIPLRGLSLHYQSTPTAEQMAAVDETRGIGMSAHTKGQTIYADPKAPHQELTDAQRAILNAVPVLDAESVRRYVATKWPEAMQSPLAQAMHGASAMAALESSDADSIALRGEAMEHAEACIAARSGWTVETLGHNIESAFGMDLNTDECDEIARAAIAKAGGAA